MINRKNELKAFWRVMSWYCCRRLFCVVW